MMAEAAYTGERCGYCDEPLLTTDVSEFWCRQSHQQLWYEARAQLLGPDQAQDPWETYRH
jgi:hypothetical protein